MAQIDSHNPGSFCWIELATPDKEGAKAFYSALFGWSINDFPMGPSETYTMFQLEGRDVGAAFQINDEMKAAGIPTYWGLYIATANVDDTAAKVQQAGGKTVKGPFDVMTFGRMAAFQDPTGAIFMAWEPKSHKGTGITGVPGTLCWADLVTGDVDAATKFYRSVFGWEIEAGKDGSGYLHIKNGEAFIGGIPPSHFKDPNVPPHWMLYFFVTDVDASTDKLKQLGGRVFMPPATMEGVGRMAIVSDPQGAAFAFFTPMRRD